jgi:hypothetical protein
LGTLKGVHAECVNIFFPILPWTYEVNDVEGGVGDLLLFSH